MTQAERNDAIKAKKKAGIPNSQLMKEYKISYATLRLILDRPEGELEK